MSQHSGKASLSPDQTKQLLGDYMQCRFHQSFNPSELARKAGIDAKVVDHLIQHQPVGEQDLQRLADCLQISVPLLSEICGLEPMSTEMYDTLNRFMDSALRPKAREHGN